MWSAFKNHDLRKILRMISFALKTFCAFLRREFIGRKRTSNHVAIATHPPSLALSSRPPIVEFSVMVASSIIIDLLWNGNF